MIQFEKNIQTDVRKQRWTDPILYGTLTATARGLASKTAINWHLKVKDIVYNAGLTKNYCITISMQKPSIHKLIQQILGSHELNEYAHF